MTPRPSVVNLGKVPAGFDPISAGISVGIMAFTAWLNRRGPQQKVASTSIVNELEPVLKENLDAYLAGPRTKSAQALHLAQFDMAWSYLKSQEGCGNPELGKPGQNCIADRSRGGQWDWASYYRDPIANDPDVQPDPQTFGPAPAALGQNNSTVSNQTLLLVALAAALLLVL
jgi:hypothetical protein